MKVSLDWLKRHLDTDASAQDIAGVLNRIGLEVDHVADRAGELEPFVVGYVVEAKQHPDADRLRVCLVDNGTDKIQVVCGAPNARTGMKGVFAASGMTIPGTGMKLKQSEIRGVRLRAACCARNARWVFPTNMTASSSCPRTRSSVNRSRPIWGSTTRCSTSRSHRTAAIA